MGWDRLVEEGIAMGIPADELLALVPHAAPPEPDGEEWYPETQAQRDHLDRMADLHDEQIGRENADNV